MFNLVSVHVSVVVEHVVNSISLDGPIEFVRLGPSEGDGNRGNIQHGEVLRFTGHWKQ